MKNKNNSKNKRIVKQQIILVLSGFFIAFLILGISAKVVLKNQQENYEKLDYLVNQSNAKSSQMTNLSDAIRDRMLIVYDILNTTDIFDIDDKSMLLSDRASDFIIAREKLMSLDLTEKQKDELVDQRKILKQAQIALQKIVFNALNETGNNQSDLIKKARDVNAGVLIRLNNMRLVQTELSQHELKAAKSSYKSTREKMVMMGLGGLAICLSIVFVVIHQIRAQGDTLTDVMQQLEDSNQTLENRVEKRTKQLIKTREDNLRMGAELDISRQLQKVILPTEKEISEIDSLDIAAFMEPADEIGGDYYEVLKHAENGGVLIGIGDVTGHGLESGMVMLMIQSIIRSQSTATGCDLIKMLQVANKTIHDNVSRMNSEKNLSLMLLDYQQTAEGESDEPDKPAGIVRYSGQHESMLVIRSNGQVEEFDTDELGFPVGLVEDADDFFKEGHLELYKGDTVVLYTDGITEAANAEHELYGIERLREIAVANFKSSAVDIKDKIIAHVKQYIGEQKIYDDLTLLVFKQV